jgi:hypothetical protein
MVGSCQQGTEPLYFHKRGINMLQLSTGTDNIGDAAWPMANLSVHSGGLLLNLFCYICSLKLIINYHFE